MGALLDGIPSTAHFYLRRISKIRHILDRRTTATLVHAYVTSRLDNGNELLFGLPEILLSRLQKFYSYMSEEPNNF